MLIAMRKKQTQTAPAAAQREVQVSSDSAAPTSTGGPSSVASGTAIATPAVDASAVGVDHESGLVAGLSLRDAQEAISLLRTHGAPLSYLLKDEPDFDGWFSAFPSAEVANAVAHALVWLGILPAVPVRSPQPSTPVEQQSDNAAAIDDAARPVPA